MKEGIEMSYELPNLPRLQNRSKLLPVQAEVLEYISTEAVTESAQANAERILAQLFEGLDLASYSALFSLFRKVDSGEVNPVELVVKLKQTNGAGRYGNQ
jgi:hypothetical protein